MPTFPVSYYRNGETTPFWMDESETAVLPRIGDGWLWDDGTRYRVVDVWHSFEHHGGVLNDGPHVFLETVATGTEDDRPYRMNPGYFDG